MEKEEIIKCKIYRPPTTPETTMVVKPLFLETKLVQIPVTTEKDIRSCRINCEQEDYDTREEGFKFFQEEQCSN